MNLKDNIFIAGHNGMVGRALNRLLEKKGYKNLIKVDRKELDLTNQKEVSDFFSSQKIDYVFLAAAKVGGILANSTYRAQFLYENLMIQSNVINASHLFKIKKLLFFGSACIYPKLADQPIKEQSLLKGSLEPTNEPYAIAKIAGIKLCQSYYDQYSSDFISIMPNNLYGPYDNFDPMTSHVLPALLRKIHIAKNKNQKNVVIWGTGKPLREFLHVDDLADAALFIMNEVSSHQIYGSGISHINIGSGEEFSIADLALMISDIIGFKGEIKFDKSKPDGTPRKILDTSLLDNLEWESKIKIENGILSLYQWYLNNIS